MFNRMTAQLVCDALKIALRRRGMPKGFISPEVFEVQKVA
jgi:hypothetical protein